MDKQSPVSQSVMTYDPTKIMESVRQMFSDQARTTALVSDYFKTQSNLTARYLSAIESQRRAMQFYIGSAIAARKSSSATGPLKSINQSDVGTSEQSAITIPAGNSTESPITDVQARDELSTRIQQAIKDNHFEYGIRSGTDDLIALEINRNPRLLKEAINTIYYKEFRNKDPLILLGLVRAIGRIDQSLIAPEGPIMALASLSHADIEVKEAAVVCFESWRGIDSLHVLEQVRVGDSWLQGYIDKIIIELREEACISS